MRVTILALCTVATATAFVAPGVYQQQQNHHQHTKTTTTTCLREAAAPQNNVGDPRQWFGDPAQMSQPPSPPPQGGGVMRSPAPPPPQFGGNTVLWPVEDKWDQSSSILVHGETLRTSSLPVPVNNIHMMLKSDGRPIVAKYELWMGPDYTPWILQAYSEDGITRPVNAMIATPKRENTIAIRNTANMEFPFEVCMKIDNGLGEVRNKITEVGKTQIIQGGALRSYPLPEQVESCQILLKTDGRHLKAKVELLQGPNNVKQAFEVYASDGSYRPLHVVLDTPGSGNMVRIINKLTMEYPILATVVPLAAKDKRTGDVTYL